MDNDTFSGKPRFAPVELRREKKPTVFDFIRKEPWSAVRWAMVGVLSTLAIYETCVRLDRTPLFPLKKDVALDYLPLQPGESTSEVACRTFAPTQYVIITDSSALPGRPYEIRCRDGVVEEEKIK